MAGQGDGRRVPVAPQATVVDFHVHAFPDALAARATARIPRQTGSLPSFDGTVSGLLASMDAAGIERSVVLSVATRPAQSRPILEWSRRIRGNRIVPFLSVHPADPHAVEAVEAAAADGFAGFKFHPYDQDFFLDEERMFPIYEALEKTGLLCLSHTGFDLSHPFERRADPPRIVAVLRRFPRLRFVASHLGSWRDWQLVARLLPRAGLWTDLSYSLPYLSREAALALIAAFPPDRILFGTDAPWADQGRGLADLCALGLEPGLEAAILGGNAARLLPA